MQKGVRAILARLPLNPRNACASNLIFIRSREKSSIYESKRNLIDRCWPAHDFILRTVQPNAILAIDTDAFDEMHRRFGRIGSNIERFDAMWGSQVCRSTVLQIADKEVLLVGTPNLSRYTPYTSDRASVLQALVKRLQPCLEPGRNHSATPRP